jgi:hypothetical protein
MLYNQTAMHLPVLHLTPGSEHIRPAVLACFSMTRWPMRTCAVMIVGTLGCAPAMGTRAGEDPVKEILRRAISEAGGAEALERAGALEWQGVATVQAGGNDVHIAGNWQVQPPDSAVVTTYEVSQGPRAQRSLVLAAPRGWLVGGKQFTPMPAPMLASERAEFYLYQLLRLTPLLGPEFKLSEAPPDSLNQTGIKVDQPGRPSAWLYVDTCGRLAHVRLQVPSARSGEPEWQDAWLSGVIESEGVRWPRELRLLVNGKPYFDLLLQSFKVMPRLSDRLLSGPR